MGLVKVLERNGRLDVGWKWLRQEGTKPGFLRIGITAAVLKAEATIPFDSGEMKRLVR